MPERRALVLALLCHVDGDRAAIILRARDRVNLANASEHGPVTAGEAARLATVVDYVRLVVSTAGSAGLRSVLDSPVDSHPASVIDVLARGTIDEIEALRSEYLSLVGPTVMVGSYLSQRRQRAAS